MKQLLNELDIIIKKPEGDQYLCICPWCMTNHLYINKQTGLWDCKRGCGHGNAYQLAERITKKPAREVFQLLEKIGIKSGNGDGKPATPQVKPKPSIKPFIRQLAEPTDEQIQQLCKAKSISENALRQLSPLALAEAGVICLPGHTRGQSEPCGFLRVRWDGQPIQLRSGKSEKYPAIGQHGLLGTQNLAASGCDTILIVEAWRDLCAALAADPEASVYTATASTGGASTFKAEWIPVFVGKHVIICMDADNAGQKHAQRVAKALYSTASSVRIAKLPYETKDKHGKDLYDYLSEGGDIQDIIDAAEEYQPEKRQQTDSDKYIVLDDNHPDTIARAFEQWQNESGIIHRHHLIDGWTMYKGGKYQRIESDDKLARYVRQFVSEKIRITKRRKKKDGEWEETIEKPDKADKNRANIMNIIDYLRGFDEVHIYDKDAAPSWIGRQDGKPERLVAVNNGLLDWSRWPIEILPHTPDYYTLNYLPYDYSPDAKCDLWDQFLVDATQGNVELMILLQQFAGYCLMPHDHKQQKFLLIYGESGTGKSVYADILTRMVGVENTSAIRLSMFADTHMLTQTYGKLLNICDETEETFLDPQAENALKQYTGGTMITFKELYKKSFSAYPTAKICMTTNHKPRLKDSSDASFRRVLMCPFNNVVPEPEMNKNLKQDIIRNEMGGVLAWALQGARMIMDKGTFINPEISKKEMESYKLEQHPERQFLSDNFEISDSEDEAPVCKYVRRGYEMWGKDNHFGIKNDTNFGRSFKKMFPNAERKRVRKGGARQWIYAGVRVKTDSEYYDIMVDTSY